MYSNEFIPQETDPKFESKEALVQKIAERILAEKSRNESRGEIRPYIVGFDGPPAAGKTTISADIVAALKSEGKKVAIVRADHYMRKSEERKPSNDPDPGFTHYTSTIDDNALENEILRPLKERRRLQGQGAETLLFDIHEDDRVVPHTYDIDENTIVIVEGIYLFKERIQHYFDLKVFLDADADTLVHRALTRNAVGSDQDITNRPVVSPVTVETSVRRRYVEGYNIYRELDLPDGSADVLVETSEKGYCFLAVRPIK